MSLLDIGVSGLRAFQSVLNTTAHNVANATTEGYNRQQVDLISRDAQFIQGAYFGQGVIAQGTRRIQDDFLDMQVRTGLSDNGYGETRAAFAERVDRFLSNDATGLTPTLKNYFSAIQDAAVDPTSSSARTVVLGRMQDLTERFHAMNSQLDDQRTLLNGQLTSSINEINQYSVTLADLNSKIIARSTNSAPANDLLDQRDQLLRKLSAKIDLNVAEQNDGSINVFIGNGQPLVVRDTASQLFTENYTGDPRNPGIGMKVSKTNNSIDVTRFMTGGEIGALLETRTNILDPAQNTLGLLAVNISHEFNAQNHLGLNANGELGGDLFNIDPPRVLFDPSNTATGIPSVINTNPRELMASDYQLSFDGKNYQLITKSDQKAVAITIDSTNSNILHAGGLTIDTSGIKNAESGDRWLIQPTRDAAGTLNVAITDPNQLAATAGALADKNNTGTARITGLQITAPEPLSAETRLPATVIVNQSGNFNLLRPSYGATAGDAKITGFSVIDAKNSSLTTPTTIKFDAAKQQFQVDNNWISLDKSGSTTIAANGWELTVRGTPEDGAAFTIDSTTIPAAQNQAGTTTINGSSWALDITGKPAAGDIFTVDLSKGRTGDNRNLLALSDLQDASVIENKQDFQSKYNDLVVSIGTNTQQAKLTRDAYASVLETAQNDREALSGVNLDEEAATLVRFQQAYQAAAQVISTSNSLFGILLAAVKGQ